MELSADRLGFVLEAFIAKALGLAQAGHPEDAMVALEQGSQVGGHVSPYLSSVRALVCLAMGDYEAALADAKYTLDHAGASYLDRAYAGLAEAFAHSRLESPGAADAALAAAEATVGATGDVVAHDLLALGRSFLDGGGDAEFELPLKGWRRLFTHVMAA